MTAIAGSVQQQSREVTSDGLDKNVHVNRGGQLETNNIMALYDSWVRAGRVFETHNATIGTMITGGVGITLTVPSFRFTVPSTRVVVPISVQIAAVTVVNKDDHFIVVATHTDTYTSGGLAGSTVQPLFIDNLGAGAPESSAVTNVYNNDTTLTEAALVAPRQLKSMFRVGVAAEVQMTWQPEYNILKGDPWCYIHGPGSFLVFVGQETTAPEFSYCVTWAELDKNELVNN